MPVLARTLEEAGLATVLVTMMPVWAQQIGTPRTLAVEFPFTHTLGQPGNTAQQLRVVRHSLELLESADQPGLILHSDEQWPQPLKTAIDSWQPREPSPIVSVMGPQIRKLLRDKRAKRG